MKKEPFRKIVYFDKETINNALQKQNEGRIVKTQNQGIEKAIHAEMEAKVETTVYLGIPILGRLKLLFSGKLDTQYLREWSSQTTVTSTDIGMFKQIEKDLVSFDSVQLKDVKNSLTSFRMAATFTKLLKLNNQDINFREMADLLSEMEGYDLYDIGNRSYVRFNQSAYLSNYKRQDILMTYLDLYCVKVGEYEEIDFDYLTKLTSMQSLFDASGLQDKTLGDILYAKELENSVEGRDLSSNKGSKISLYDVVCAYVSETYRCENTLS